MKQPPKRKAHTTYRPKARAIPLNSAAWQRIREQVLAEQPLCPICTRRGLVVPAVHVDHIDNDGDNNARENLQALCHECHSLKTAQDMGKRVFWGCDVNGRPLDPAHHWNREEIASNRGLEDRVVGAALTLTADTDHENDHQTPPGR